MGEKQLEQMIDREELAKALKMSIQYIDGAIKNERLPAYKLGKSVRFYLSEVQSWLKERKIRNG